MCTVRYEGVARSFLAIVCVLRRTKILLVAARWVIEGYETPTTCVFFTPGVVASLAYQVLLCMYW